MCKVERLENIITVDCGKKLPTIKTFERIIDEIYEDPYTEYDYYEIRLYVPNMPYVTDCEDFEFLILETLEDLYCNNPIHYEVEESIDERIEYEIMLEGLKIESKKYLPNGQILYTIKMFVRHEVVGFTQYDADAFMLHHLGL